MIQRGVKPFMLTSTRNMIPWTRTCNMARRVLLLVVNNYYNDPNDYYYSSNLRRFSDEYYGWDYYDPYYTSYVLYRRAAWAGE